MLLTSVVDLIQDEGSDVIANLAANNGIIGTFLYFVGIMAIVIFIGAWLTSPRE
jgi:hypothetical protein